MSSDDPLYDDPALADFYDLENGWADDTRYCRDLAGAARSVLDLGCGTGLLAASLGQGRSVVGVDPAGAMLDIARARLGGAQVVWVQADARSVRLGRRFDLVVLTGHAFQVFLTQPDRAAVLATIAAHLEPAGRFIFDSRNPVREEWREWTPDRSLRTLAHPVHGEVRAWNDVSFDGDVVTYETIYEIVGRDRRLTARSSIAFPRRDELARLIGEAGLAVDAWLGDWQGAPFQPDSPEIIPLGRRR